MPMPPREIWPMISYFPIFFRAGSELRTTVAPALTSNVCMQEWQVTLLGSAGSTTSERHFGQRTFTDMRGVLYYRPSMDERKLRTLLQRFRSGKLDEDALLRELRGLPFG